MVRSQRKELFPLIALFAIVLAVPVGVGCRQVWVTLEHMYPPGSLKAEADAARTQLNLLAGAVRLYTADSGQPPSSAQGMSALVQRPTRPPSPRKWRPCLNDVSQIPPDPWGNRYVYWSSGAPVGLFRITSYGRDGMPGGVGLDADFVVGGGG